MPVGPVASRMVSVAVKVASRLMRTAPRMLRAAVTRKAGGLDDQGGLVGEVRIA